MGEISETTPKSILPIGDTNIICRLINQLLNEGINEITIVVGYKEDLVKKTIKETFGQRFEFISNKRFEEDINILSLSLALEDLIEGKFVVFEADCLYEDKAISHILNTCKDNRSYWYTIGTFESEQMGGILLSDNENSVKDIRIVPQYEDKYSKYNKLIGVLKVGSTESSKYIELINKYKKQSVKQYYLQPWIDHLDILNCSEVSLKAFRSGAFNDLNEYNKVLEIFKD